MTSRIQILWCNTKLLAGNHGSSNSAGKVRRPLNPTLLAGLKAAGPSEAEKPTFDAPNASRIWANVAALIFGLVPAFWLTGTRAVGCAVAASTGLVTAEAAADAIAGTSGAFEEFNAVLVVAKFSSGVTFGAAGKAAAAFAGMATSSGGKSSSAASASGLSPEGSSSRTIR